jgi:hypothetical protein
VSADPEIPGIPLPDTVDQLTIHRLIDEGGASDWARGLASRGVRFVLVAKEVDWQTYSYLDLQAGLVQVGDYGSVVLYRVMDVK